MKKVLFFLTLFLLTGFIYRDALGSYFFQDDWFSFRISQAGTVKAFLSFFLPRSDIIYYRPLGMQMPFFFLQNLFGINPLPFHLVQFVTHIINGILVYLLVRLILKRELLAFLSSFFYVTSSIHYIPFYWFATYAFVLGSTFFFSSFISFIKFLEKKKSIHLFFSFSLFLLGLLVNEMVIISPIIFLFFIFYKKKTSKFLLLSPFFIISIIFVVFRFFLFPAPTSGLYSMTVGKHILNNLEAYILWSFNWPEEMKAQLLNFVTVNPEFIKGFFSYYFIFVFSLLFFIILWYIIPLILIFREKKKAVFSLIIFCASWFIIGLLPIIFFPHHSFSYYLPMSFVGFLILSLALFDITLKKLERKQPLHILSIVSVIIVWLLVSMATIDFNQKVHWAPRRAKQAELLIKKAKVNYSPQTITISIFPSSENKLSLNDQDAFKVIFANEAIVTQYTVEAKGKEIR